MKKTQITSQTYRLPLSIFSQSATVALDPDPTKVLKHVLIHKSYQKTTVNHVCKGFSLSTAAFKLRVIAYAVSRGNFAAGRQFLID